VRRFIATLVLAGCAGGHETRVAWRAPQGTPSKVTELSAFERLCTEGDGAACANAGLFYLAGKEVPLDRGQAESLFRRGCDAGEAIACYDLAVSLDERHAQADEAKRLFDELCTRSHVASCAASGDLAYSRRDFERARTLWERSCASGVARSCNNLGVLYDNGQGVAKDRAAALSWFERACSAGEPLGCENRDQRRR
jgi:TPR repeat protein